MQDTQDILDEYEVYLIKTGIAGNSVLSYKRDTGHFLNWLPSSGRDDLKALGTYDIDAYLKSLKASGKSSSTITRRVSSLRRFFSWAKSKGLVYIDPMSGISAPKVMKKTPEIAGSDDIVRMIESLSCTGCKDIRDRAMLTLIMSTGMNTTELLGIKYTDVDLKGKAIKVAGRSQRVIRLDKKAYTALKQYVLDARPILDHMSSGIFFLSCRGTALSRQGFWKNVNSIAKKAGIEHKITPAALKLSYTVNAIKQGENG